MISLFPGRGMMEVMERQKKGSRTGSGAGVIAENKGGLNFAHKIGQR
jgi:hypothetical protein